MSTTEAPTSEGLHLLTFPEAAAYLGKSFTVRWIERHAFEGPRHERIPTVRIGNRRLIRRDGLASWFEAQCLRDEAAVHETVVKRKKTAAKRAKAGAR